MKNSPKVIEAAQEAFSELMELTIEEIQKMFDEAKLGPVGEFMKMMDDMEDL